MVWIGGSWNPATVSTLAGIFGSLASAFASTLGAWIAQKHHEQQDLLTGRMSHSEQLYSDSIDESARAMVDAMQPAGGGFAGLYAAMHPDKTLARESS